MPSGKLPDWYLAARAVLLLMIGVLILLHEVYTQIEAVRIVVIVAAFLLMGFSAQDITSLYRRGSE